MYFMSSSPVYFRSTIPSHRSSACSLQFDVDPFYVRMRKNVHRKREKNVEWSADCAHPVISNPDSADEHMQHAATTRHLQILSPLSASGSNGNNANTEMWSWKKCANVHIWANLAPDVCVRSKINTLTVRFAPKLKGTLHKWRQISRSAEPNRKKCRIHHKRGKASYMFDGKVDKINSLAFHWESNRRESLWS